MPPRDYSGAARRSDGVAMTIKVDGVPYRFDLRDVTAAIELELYRQAGLRLSKVIEEIADGPTGFHVAAIVFLARRSEGDEVTFDEIASSMGIGSDIEIVTDDDGDGDGGPPEAPAAG